MYMFLYIGFALSFGYIVFSTQWEPCYLPNQFRPVNLSNEQLAELYTI